jgi:predicted nucleotidyltransferase
VTAGSDIDIDRLAEVAARHPSAELVVLFGSVARGTPFRWSDADIGVLGGSWMEQLALGAELGRVIGRDPHVVDLARASEALRHEISSHGRLISETRAGAWARYRAESFVRWFDLAPIRRLCAGGVRRRLLRQVRGG